MFFLVTLNTAAAGVVTVTFNTSNGTALAGQDYLATTGTITFQPGVQVQTITVPIVGDPADEDDEQFSVNLLTVGGNAFRREPEVADRHGIPQRFLVQILLQLKAGGLVASTRGAAGGYQLARAPDEITLADVLDVVDPPEPPAGGRKGDVSPLAAALQDKWDEIADARRKVLENTTIADLVAAGQGMQYVI